MLLNDLKLDEDLRLVGLVLTIKIEFNYLSQVSINIPIYYNFSEPFPVEAKVEADKSSLCPGRNFVLNLFFFTLVQLTSQSTNR